MITLLYQDLAEKSSLQDSDQVSEGGSGWENVGPTDDTLLNKPDRLITFEGKTFFFLKKRKSKPTFKTSNNRYFIDMDHRRVRTNHGEDGATGQLKTKQRAGKPISLLIGTYIRLQQLCQR